MRRHGCCTLPVNEADRVLDRLAGLEKVISTDAIRQALLATGRVNPRSCKLTHEVMLWIVLAMGVLTNMPIRQVFKHARRLRRGEETPGRSSLCEARQRLGAEPVQYLHEHTVRPLATPDTPGAFYRGLRLMGIDGSVFDVPDSPANAAAFARASGGRGDGAFPQVRKASLVELGTHVEVAIAIGGWQDSETELARQLWDKVPPDTLLRRPWFLQLRRLEMPGFSGCEAARSREKQPDLGTVPASVGRLVLGQDLSIELPSGQGSPGHRRAGDCLHPE